MWRARGGCVVLFFALLQIRLPLPAALLVNGTVERSVWLTSCRRDADCPSRRMACNAGWPVPAGGSVCQCSRWLYTSEAPRCKTLNASTFTVTLLLLLVAVPSLVAAYLHTRALLEHMRGSSTQAPARPSLGCRGHCLMSIKGPFLLTSLASSLSLAIRLVTYVLMFWVAEDWRWWSTNSKSPYVVVFSLWAFMTVAWVFLVVCLWVRVAAQLHDPRQPPQGCIWRLLVTLNGTACGTLLAAFVGLPIGTVLASAIIKVEARLATTVSVLFVLAGSFCLFLGTWLLRSARPEHSAREQWPKKRSWALFFGWRARVAPATSSTGHNGSGGLPSQGATGQVGRQKPHRQEKTPDVAEEDTVQLFRSEDFIDSVSASAYNSRLDDSLFSSVAPIRTPRPLHLSPSASPTQTDEEASSAVIDFVSPTTPPSQISRQEGIGSGTLEQKLSMVHRDAQVLASRTATLLCIGSGLFVLAEWCRSNRLPFYTQLWRQLGNLAWLYANLNCLYYLSPSFRHTMLVWASSDSCLRSCIGVLLDPHFGSQPYEHE